MALQPHNQQLFKVVIAGEDGGTVVEAVFASNLSGQGWARDTTDYADPEKSRIKMLVGFIKINDVTLTSLFDSAQYGLITWLKAQKINPTKFTCTMTPTDASLDAKNVGTPFVMSGCQLISATYPELDKDSVGTSKIALSFRPEDIE
jgi:hypothetical protein